MIISKSRILSAICVGICLFCLVHFHSVPVNRPWKGYDVLYVSKNVDENTVLGVLSDAGCRDILSFSLQKLPITSKFNSVQDADSLSYIQKRDAYFFDKNSDYRLYYIPETYRTKGEQCKKIIAEKYDSSAGLDASSRMPWIPVAICTILFLFLCIMAEHRMVYAFFCLFPLVFIFCMPFYTNAAAVCICEYGLFLIQRVWHRSGMLHYIRKNPYILIFLIIPFIVMFAESISSGLLYLCSVAGNCVVLYFCSYSPNKDRKNKSDRFLPVYILPAKMIPAITDKTVKSLAFCAAGVFSLLLLFAVSGRTDFSGSKGLYLPSPNGYTNSKSLPDLGDYVVWYWDTVTFPYRSLNGSHISDAVPKNGDTVSFPRYIQTESGIKEHDEIVYRFGKQFSDSVIGGIDTLPYPSVEKLIKEQGSGFSAGYSKMGATQFSIKGLLILLVSFLIPSVLLIYMIGGRRKYVQTI